MNCEATVEDYANGTTNNLRHVIVTPKSRPCSRAATCRLGTLHFCGQHAKLAKEGLVDEQGRVAPRGDLRAVRDNPRRFSRGLYQWARGLPLEQITYKAVRKRGRPARADEAADVKVTVRLTPSERDEIRSLIGRAPMSKWLRDVGLKAARRAQ